MLAGTLVQARVVWRPAAKDRGGFGLCGWSGAR